MNTDDLIRTLAADTRRVPPGAGAWRVAGALLAGGFVALLAIDMLFGPPLRAVTTTGVMVFTVKLAYAVAMTALAASLLLAAGRPGRRLGIRCLWLLVPPLVVAAAAATELDHASAGSQAALVLGSTWQTPDRHRGDERAGVRGPALVVSPTCTDPSAPDGLSRRTERGRDGELGLCALLPRNCGFIHAHMVFAWYDGAWGRRCVARPARAALVTCGSRCNRSAIRNRALERYAACG